MKQIHILNGDSLKEQFPTVQIHGEMLVARECLIEGPSNAKSLDAFLQIRSDFIKKSYGGSYAGTAEEIRKINSLTDAEVNLWFEEDLFCQANLWFVCSLLYLKRVNVFLVMPKDSLRYGFGGLNEQQLIEAFQNKKALTPVNVNQFALLWFAYQKNHIERLLKLGVQMHSDFPFVMRAIEAHFDRLPKGDKPGLPEQLILDIMEEKSTNDFGTIFREFIERAPIYGFGDLQIKRIFDEIQKNQEQ
ncbi:MAG: DUF1835 domain-containing protein [Ekhidna sp.]